MQTSTKFKDFSEEDDFDRRSAYKYTSAVAKYLAGIINPIHDYDENGVLTIPLFTFEVVYQGLGEQQMMKMIANHTGIAPDYHNFFAFWRHVREREREIGNTGYYLNGYLVALAPRTKVSVGVSGITFTTIHFTCTVNNLSISPSCP